ncbi:hypothetical protein NDU88_005517 [Pleurodeles waltl]|uniref:Uncharacterized protein n=1 Tax=Pleurodeles waltl TaxID=8319 RepID=A0AAV7M9J6_PLEWA|nr:hypothetical protein NDU88_005517 [Pleurodeles waltl]
MPLVLERPHRSSDPQAMTRHRAQFGASRRLLCAHMLSRGCGRVTWTEEPLEFKCHRERRSIKAGTSPPEQRYHWLPGVT